MSRDNRQKSEMRMLREENARLHRAVEELSVLNDLARDISASSDLDEILRTIIRQSVRALDAEQGVISLVDEKQSRPTETLVRTMESAADHRPYRLSQDLIGWMHHHRQPLLINDPSDDPRIRQVSSSESVRSILCVPLMVRSSLIGIVTVLNRKGNDGFSPSDQRLLAIIAGQSAQVIENARLHEEEKRLLVMEEELRVARDIQGRLMPTGVPELPGYEIAGKSIPAREVGGDYFDYIPMSDRGTGLCLGDVSGKGLPAALLMANLQATLRGQALSTDSAEECISRANQLICNSVSLGRFITLFYGVLDAKKGRLTYVNAGHNPPLLWRNGARAPEELTTGGLILGVMANAPYREAHVPMHPGDQLVIYSDGVTEALDTDGAEYGEARLRERIAEHREEAAECQIDTIVKDVRTHARRASQSDDITLLIIRRL